MKQKKPSDTPRAIIRILTMAALTLCTLPSWAWDEGVPLALAKLRANQLGNLRYQLDVTLPNERTAPVCGTVEISFERKGKDDVTLDFEGRNVDKTCTVNGVDTDTEWTQGHIRIAAALLREGANSVRIGFTADDKALNRHDDYLYTLFVPALAHTVFPCFDQPDLKARFTVNLRMPEGWTSLHSDASHPIPTYLFSFTAGRFSEATALRNGRKLRMLYRETDPKKTAQAHDIMDEAAQAIAWMERYTGIDFPWGEYGFVVLPGYQFGGMEHPGAIQYNDSRIFLDENPTQQDRITRTSLIAHETAHLWFGDLVTMRWFDDVWTKEVFANFMADKVCRERFPDIDHDVNFLKAYQSSALATDRTEGTHPIQQPLDNLRDAGLLYGNIIYNKAPVMMRKLEEQMGEEALRKGLADYLRRYAYANATWDSLIDILAAHAPGCDLHGFSDVWVKQRGLPIIRTRYEDGQLVVTQSDPYGRGLCWPQRLCMGLYMAKGDKVRTVEVDMREPEVRVPIDREPYVVLPNYDGSGYGRFETSATALAVQGYAWQVMPNKLHRYAAVMNLYENYLMNRMKPSELLNTMNTFLMNEEDEQVATALCGYIGRVYRDIDSDSKRFFEYYLYNDATTHPLPSVRKQLMRLLSTSCLSETICDSVYHVWQERTDTLLGEQDYIQMAYHLAIMRPAQWQEILQVQRERIGNEDKRREFDFVSRACNPDPDVRRQLFESLLDPTNRRVEPWAARMLALLNSYAFEPQSNEYLRIGLDALQDIQHTGDIFFPTNWLHALLGGHVSEEAGDIVNYWIKGRTGYPEALTNKVKECAYPLLRAKRGI